MEATSPAESRVIGLVRGIVGRVRAEALVASVETDAALLRRVPAGVVVLRPVPGSFFEFITRHRRADGRLDLGFDTSDAHTIFQMTAPVLA